MDWKKFEAQWNVYSGSARAHWSKLNDEDWKSITGKKAQLVGRIQERYGVSEADASKQVDEWSASLVTLADIAAGRR